MFGKFFKRKLSRSTTLLCKYCGCDEYYIKKAHHLQLYVCGNCDASCSQLDLGRYSNLPFESKENYWMMVANQLNILGRKI